MLCPCPELLIFLSSLTIPGKYSVSLVAGLLWSVEVFECALHVLNWDLAHSACTICLAKQPFLGACTSHTHGLNCEVWDNSREDMTLLKMSIWTNPSRGWPTDQKKAPRENTAKQCGKLLPLQWGTGVLLWVQINQVQADIPSCQVSPLVSLRRCCSGKPFSPSSFIPLNCPLKCALFLANDVALLCYINEFVV